MAIFPAKILVGVEDTPPARRALDAGIELQGATGSELVLVHVKLLTHYITGDAPSPAAYEKAEQEGRAFLAAEADRARNAGATVAEALLRMGRQIDTELVNVANEVGATLLVLGSKARKPQGASVRVGVSLDLVRDAPCSVLFARERDESRAGPLRAGTVSTEPHDAPG